MDLETLEGRPMLSQRRTLQSEITHNDFLPSPDSGNDYNQFLLRRWRKKILSESSVELWLMQKEIEDQNVT